MSTNPLPDLPAGIWQHYKGPYYQVFGYSHDANYEDRRAVVYIGLELAGAHSGPRLAARTAVSSDPEVDAWWDSVHDDGTKCLHVDNCNNCSAGRTIRPRFRYVGPDLAR